MNIPSKEETKENKIIYDIIQNNEKDLKKILKKLYKEGIYLTNDNAYKIISELKPIRIELKNLLKIDTNNQYRANYKNDENLRMLLDAYAKYSSIEIIYEEDLEDELNDTYNGNDLLFQSVKNYPVLSEEEFNKLYLEYKKGNSKARDKIICSNQRLALKIANQYLNKRREIEDLFQIGVQGLIIALDYYDPNKNSKFSSYATWHIRREIEQSIRNNEGIYKTSNDLNNKTRIIKKCTEQYYAKKGCQPTIEEIQKQTGYSLQEIKDALEHMSVHSFSLNDQITSDSENTYASIIKDESVDIAKDYENKDLINYIFDEIYTFEDISETEIEIAKLRLGFYNGQEYTLTEVGQRYGITRERVRQIQNKVTDRIKYIISEEYKTRSKNKQIEQINIPLFSIFLTKQEYFLEAIQKLSNRELKLLKLKYTITTPTYTNKITKEEETAINEIVNKINNYIAYKEKESEPDTKKANKEQTKAIQNLKITYHNTMNDLINDLPSEIRKKYIELLTKPLTKLTNEEAYYILNIISPYLDKRSEVIKTEKEKLENRVNTFIQNIKKENLKEEVLKHLDFSEKIILKKYINNDIQIIDLRILGNTIIPRLEQIYQRILKELNYKYKSIKFYLIRNKKYIEEIKHSFTQEEIALISSTIESSTRISKNEIDYLENNIIPTIKRVVSEYIKESNRNIEPNIFELMEKTNHEEETVLQALSYLDPDTLELLYKGYGKDFTNTNNYDAYTQAEKLKIKNQVIPYIERTCQNIEDNQPILSNIKGNRMTIRERLKNFDDETFNAVYNNLTEEEKKLCELADSKEQLTKEEERKRNNIINRLISQARYVIQKKNNLRSEYGWNAPVLKKKKNNEKK